MPDNERGFSRLSAIVINRFFRGASALKLLHQRTTKKITYISNAKFELIQMILDYFRLSKLAILSD
jgi:hypothetical protein